MLKNKPNVYRLALLCLTTIASSNVLADQYHYNNILIGNRAAGLAGSYVAIADDPSGLYYNPSGIVYSASGNITANMNAYNISQTTYKAALRKENGKTEDYVRTSASLVPNFFGITQPLGPGTVGFSYAVTDSILEEQGQTFNDIYQSGTVYTINFNNQDGTNNVGPSYALRINDKFSVGLTLYGYFRTQKLISNQIVHLPIQTGDTQHSFEIINSYNSLSDYGVKPILGFMYSPMEKLSLGLTLSQVFIVNSTSEYQGSYATNICKNEERTLERCDLSKQPTFDLVKSTTDLKRHFPWKINLGAAYFYSNRLMFTSNIWLYESLLPSKPASGNSLHDAIHYTFLPLVNVAAGAEYYITGKIAIRLGAYTNFANTPIKPSNDYYEHIDIMGTTISFTHFTRSSAISVGAAGTYGVGKAKITSGSQIQDVSYAGMSVFLSASNSF